MNKSVRCCAEKESITGTRGMMVFSCKERLKVKCQHVVVNENETH